MTKKSEFTKQKSEKLTFQVEYYTYLIIFVCKTRKNTEY